MSLVPKILWQSYKSIGQMPADGLLCTESWLCKNPDWSYHFCSDRDVEAFFRVYQGGRYVDLLQAMPLAVMKADLWRYAILEEFGGFYTDIDTYCFHPLDDWLDRSVGFHVACEEDETYFCQWAFAAAPHHLVLRTVMELIEAKVRETDGVDETIPHYVHHYTGPSMWTEAIQQALGRTSHPSALEEEKALQRSKNLRIYPSGYFGGAKLHHFNGSIFWRDVPGYESWQRQRMDLANRIV